MAKAKAGADTESLELLHTAGEKVKCYNHFGSFFIFIIFVSLKG